MQVERRIWRILVGRRFFQWSSGKEATVSRLYTAVINGFQELTSGVSVSSVGPGRDAGIHPYPSRLVSTVTAEALKISPVHGCGQASSLKGT